MIIYLRKNKEKVKEFSNGNSIDLAIVIGGDGTVLDTKNLLSSYNEFPHFFTFDEGTVGYLTHHDLNKYEEILDELLEKHEGNISLEKRSTLHGRFITTNEGEKLDYKDEFILNEGIFQRQINDPILEIDLFIDNELLTHVKGEGIIISTSTGSTGYNLSSRGPIIYYGIDCMLLNVIDTLSISFVPLILPKGLTMKGIVTNDSFPYVSSDSRDTVKLAKGQGFELSVSDKYLNIILVEKYLSQPFNFWKKKLNDQLGWNSSYKSLKILN